ncbi:MAG: MBOAT family protein, partial [Lachnospiraceae bacterium]|nr:MBOAT family protein [Lachnospiraceae bacterium]
MLFNSHIFIFIFLPIALAGWFLLNRIRLYKIAGFFLIGMSLWFYGYFNPAYLILIIASLSLNYIVSFLIDKVQKARKAVFILGLCLNIGILGYFKYYDFFVENINALFKTGFSLKHILLPLGISFFTLQQISYLADRYKNTAPHYGILEYAGYVTFFPQLIAGPI